MNNNYKGWQRLLLFSLGLFIGTAFCMKWMESEFLLNGKKFSIIGLEIYYSKAKIIEIITGIDIHVKSILKYQLVFDFAFMAGVYPGIASLCMIAYNKTTKKALKRILLIFGLLQIVAWLCDIVENIYLLNWISDPTMITDTGLYHIFVFLKWILALSAVILSIPIAMGRNKN